MKIRFPFHMPKLTKPKLLQFNKQKALNLGLGMIILAMCIGIGILAKEQIFTNTAPVQKSSPSKVAAEVVHQTLGPPNVDIAAIYPFYIESAKETPAIVPPSSNGSPNGRESLPAIPAYQPRPNVGSIPIPGAPPSTPPIPQAPNEGKIQGVFVGESGKSMAIIDGKIVSEGDLYSDSRIAYIGGDGIKFDNGKTIQYK